MLELIRAYLELIALINDSTSPAEIATTALEPFCQFVFVKCAVLTISTIVLSDRNATVHPRHCSVEQSTLTPPTATALEGDNKNGGLAFLGSPRLSVVYYDVDKVHGYLPVART